MDADAKLENRIRLLLGKREKHQVLIQTQTELLKKVNAEIGLLEAKKKDRLVKNLLENLQKEGIDLNLFRVNEIVHILKEKHNDNSLDPNAELEEKIDEKEQETQETFVPSISEAFR